MGTSHEGYKELNERPDANGGTVRHLWSPVTRMAIVEVMPTGRASFKVEVFEEKGKEAFDHPYPTAFPDGLPFTVGAEAEPHPWDAALDAYNHLLEDDRAEANMAMRGFKRVSKRLDPAPSLLVDAVDHRRRVMQPQLQAAA